jgi:hypothetical protein
MKTTYAKHGIEAARLDIPIGVLDRRRPSGVRYLQGQLMQAMLPSDCFDLLTSTPFRPAVFSEAPWLSLDLEDFAHSLS